MENILNSHNKKEFEPIHTAEHILNQTMIRMFGCERSKTNHIEKKKSKCDYLLPENPDQNQIQQIEDRVNDIIALNLPVTESYVNRENTPSNVDVSKLPEDANKIGRAHV